MSTSILMEPELHPIATKTKIQEESETYEEADAKRFLCVGHFYWTNAGFPKELDRSKAKYTESPLRSFHTLPLLRPIFSERELLRVSTDTTIRLKGGTKPLNYKRPCYLAEYNKSTNQGVIFLGTSKVRDNAHRFAIVHSRSPEHPLLPGSLGTKPPYSFKEKETYLNISHPLRVQFAYLLNGRFPRTKNEGIPYDGHKPPRVSIASFATQSSDVSITSNDGLETSIVFDEESEQLFWKKHKKYHRDRPGQLRSDDDSSKAGPGGAGPGARGAGPSGGGAGFSGGGAGPSGGGAGSSGGSVGPGGGGTRPSGGGVELSVGGARPNVGGWWWNEAKDAPWGQVGDQRIGIDIPLVTENIYSDSDEEMDLEEFVINSDANDAPWGRVGDRRIGIDIPLVTEDIYSDSEIYSDSDEKMDLELVEEFQEVDNVADVVKPDSSSSKSMTTRPNPSDKDGSWSYTIPKPYFVISTLGFKIRYTLLDYDHLAGEWRWTKHDSNIYNDIVLSTEGLSYEHPLIFGIGYKYAGQDEWTRRILNWHSKKYIALPPPSNERHNLEDYIVGMIVDTSVRPYAFKVIEGSNRGTSIYDSTTHSWTHRQSVPPLLSNCRFSGNANVASCKGVVFIIAKNNKIVLYDTEKDKWDHVRGVGEQFFEELCGIGTWDDRVFLSIHRMPRHDKTFEIRELVSMDNPEWKKFDAMPREMYSWLINGAEVYDDFRIDVSYSSENLLIWACFNSAKKFVLCNLACKKWDKLERPFRTLTNPVAYPTSTDRDPWSLFIGSAFDKDEGKDEGKGKGQDEGKGKGKGQDEGKGEGQGEDKGKDKDQDKDKGTQLLRWYKDTQLTSM